MKVGAGAEARVHLPRLANCIECSSVSLITVVLEIRALIPGDSEHLEITLDLVYPALFRTLAVEVFDSQHHSPAL